MTRLAIWDFDGTLAQRRDETGWSTLLTEVLDAEEPGHGRLAEAFRPHLRNGFPWHTPDVPHPELCAPGAWWDSVRPLLARAYAALGYPEARADELAAAAQRLYVDPTVGWRLFDDVVPVLTRLRGTGWTHAILSNHVPELREIVTALGLDELVSTVVCSAEIGYEKPHPCAFATLLDDADAERVVMVGDNVVADVLGAEALGIEAVLVRRPDPRAQRFAPDLYGVEALLGEAIAA